MASVVQQMGKAILQNIIAQTKEDDFIEVLEFDVEYTDDEVALFIQQ